jgi:MinD-like ATPase involved in chromosome partitioning or flagellar assembly
VTDPSAPRIRIAAHIEADGSGVVDPAGAAERIPAGPLEHARASVVSHATMRARAENSAVGVTVTGAGGARALVVHPDGAVTEGPSDPSPAPEPVDTRETRVAAPPIIDAIPPIPPIPPRPPAPSVAVPTPPAEPRPAASPPAPAWQPGAAPVPAAPAEVPATFDSATPVEPATRRSFLRTERRHEPAQTGLRGALTRLGIRMAPSAAELEMRADELAVSQHWPGPRTIAVVNGKGGAGKTPATALLAAVFARYGGAGVLAWDNNQTRGTLGWRTEQGPHDSTLLELLPETERLLGTGAQAADLARFVHHQAQDKFDVLRSKPIRLAHEQRIEPADVDAIHAVAAKYYRLIVIDSGNDESDPMWLRMIDHADQIVVATTTRADHAEAGALLLEALAQRDERSAQLARRSVVVVSQADPKASAADIDDVVSGYSTLSREVVRVPFDHEMVDGLLQFARLAPSTQRAWLRAGAAVARGL